MTLAYKKTSGRIQIAVIIAAIAVGVIVELLPDSAFFPLFCYLPGRLAAIYYNAPLYMPELSFSAHGILIVEHEVAEVLVSSRCAGLCFAFVRGRVLTLPRRVGGLNSLYGL